MNIIEKIASPQRNQGMYSSQRNLIEDDTSDDIVVGTIHNVKSTSQINKAFEIEDVDIHPFPTKSNTMFMEANGDDSSDTRKMKLPKLRSVTKISKKHKTKKKDDAFEMNDITSQESTLSPSICSSKSDDEDLGFVKSPNNYEDVLIVKKSIDSINSEGVDESYKFSMKTKTKKKSKRRKASKNITDSDDENSPESNVREDIETNEKKKSINISTEVNSKIIGIHVIKCDVLENHLYLYKPFVRVYIIDKDSGVCISSKDSPVKKDQNYAMATKCYDFSTRRKIVPEWDEILMFNDELMKKIKSPANILLFFEIMDIVLSNENKEINQNFQPICWAFIKPLGNDLSSNMNKKLELQLYKIGKVDSNPNKANVYEWWKNKPWKNYPCTFSTIIMSLKAENSNHIVDNIKQKIVNDADDKNIQTMNKYIASSKALTFDKLKMEKRLNNEEIEIPNKIISVLNNADGNTTILKFSKCGKYLAYSGLENHKFIILIYKIPEIEEVVKLSHHKGLIYDICWNHKSSQLITASADNFVYIWNISEVPKWTRKKLHHSSFVYTAKFCKSNEDTIMSGCYDTIIRVWVSNSNNGDDKYTLSEELSGHTGYVNTICFTDHNEIFFSGDSDGNILKWAKGQDGWVKILAANIEEFKGEIINDLQLFPDNHRMLVVLRNSASWAINLNTMSTFTCYKNGIPNRYQVRGAVSPCGSFIFISNNIWKSSTGELCAIYNPTQFDHHPVMSLDYHPSFNLIAMSSDRKGIPVLMCCHIHGQTVDLNLGIEIYSPNMFKCDKGSSKESKKENKIKIETVKKLEEFKVSTNKSKQSKLWDLLKKMDDLLMKAKQTEADDYVVAYKKENKPVEIYDKILHEKESKIVKNESVSTVSANLTDFYERMNRFDNEIEAKPSSSQTESDTSTNLGTYTLENEKSTNVKRIKKKKPIDYDNGGSSTLSNAESLEDDQNTYNVFTNRTKK